MGQTIGDRMVKARKVHTCAWCREGIEVGETHLRWTWLDAGEFWTGRMHAECQTAATLDRRETCEDELPTDNTTRGLTTAEHNDQPCAHPGCDQTRRGHWWAHYHMGAPKPDHDHVPLPLADRLAWAQTQRKEGER